MVFSRNTPLADGLLRDSIVTQLEYTYCDLPFCRVTSASGSTSSYYQLSAQLVIILLIQRAFKFDCCCARQHEFSHWNKCPHTSGSRLDCFCHGLSIRIQAEARSASSPPNSITILFSLESSQLNSLCHGILNR